MRPEPEVRAPTAATNGRPALSRRSALEAKLLAHHCGWLQLDEIRVRKLRRDLARLLDEMGSDDPLARRLVLGEKV